MKRSKTAGSEVNESICPSRTLMASKIHYAERGLKVALLNANGISTHERECIYFFEKQDLDLMFIQDSRISLSRNFNRSSFNNSAVTGHFINKTDPYFSQVVLQRKGLRLNILPCKTQESVAVEIESSETDHVPIVFVSAYARPTDTVAIGSISRVLDGMREDAKWVVLGDFNARFPEHGCKNPTYARNAQIESLSIEYGLRRLPCEQATTIYGTTLDHCLVSGGVNASWTPVMVNLANSDHFPVILKVARFQHARQNIDSRHWRVWRVNEKRLQISKSLTEGLKHINVPFRLACNDSTECENATSALYQKFLNCVHRVLEKEVGTVKAVRSLQERNQCTIRSLEKQRDQVARFLVLQDSIDSRNVLKETHRTIQKEKRRVSNAAFFNWKTQVDELENGGMAKIISKSIKNRIPRPHVPAHAAVEELRELLGSRRNRGVGYQLRNSKSPVDCGERPFSTDEVQNILASSNRRKAQGQDDVPSWLLRDFSEELAPFLTAFFNLVLREGTLPHQWMKGRVCLLPKAPNVGKSAFRPVTILSRVRIAFEKLLLPRISACLSTYKLQGGFKVNHRTQHWSGILNDSLAESEDCGEELLVASLDCSHAFDKIEFNALLAALQTSAYKAIIRNLVVNQRLRVSGTDSWIYPERGTPQGGVLSPLRFVKAMDVVSGRMDNLPKIWTGGLQFNHLLWADDVLLFARGRRDMECAISVCRNTLLSLGLSLNEKKSKILYKKQMDPICGIHRCERIVYLGIIFNYSGVDCKMDFQMRKEKLIGMAGVIRPLGLYKGGLKVSARIAIAKTFLISRAVHALPLYHSKKVRVQAYNTLERLIADWVFGKRASIQASLSMLNQEPIKMTGIRFRGKLQQQRLLCPVWETMRISSKERKYGASRRRVFTGKLESQPEKLKPDSITGKEAASLTWKKFSRLDNCQQSLITAYLVNKFPGYKYKCSYCNVMLDRKHIKLCKFVKSDDIDWEKPAQNPLKLLKHLEKFGHMIRKQKESEEKE